jgi:Rrf2 family protein
MISKTGEYALRAVLHLAQRGGAQPQRASDIARDLGVPANYLSKILHALARAGTLVSERGPGGGFRLAKPASDLALAEVLEPFDPMARERTCLLGRPECSDQSACVVHERWKRVSEPVARFFRETTIADLLGGTVLD